MPAQNFTVNGTSHATAEAITGLTDGTAYAVQNQTGAILYYFTKATQPVDETPASVPNGGWIEVVAEAGASVWVWVHRNDHAGGKLYVEAIGDA